SVTQLTIVVPPPAVCLSVDREAAGMMRTDAEGTEGMTSGDPCGDPAVLVSPVSELATPVCSPGERLTAGGQPDAVVHPRADGDEGVVPRHRDRHGANHGRPLVPIPEFAVTVLAPGECLPGCGDPDGMTAPGADGAGGVGPSHRCRHAASLGGPITQRSEEHTSELQSRENVVCRLL